MNEKNKNEIWSPSEVFVERVFWKYTANLQENTDTEVWFQ